MLFVKVLRVKGETTKRAGKASEAPGTKPREAPKNFILCTF